MLEVCASKIGDIILSVLESKMENKLDEVKKAKIISPDYVAHEMYQLARDITEIYEK